MVKGLLYEFAVALQPAVHGSLLESMTTRCREFVDASDIHCHHQKWHRLAGKDGSRGQGARMSRRRR